MDASSPYNRDFVKRVSVVIPSYRRHEEVVRAVRSALDQTLPPMEVIVSNDGPDAEKDRLLSALDDERVRFLEAPRRGNASATRNYGIWRAKGDWVALLDDDDVWLPRKLAVQFAVLGEASLREAIVVGREAVYYNGRHFFDRPRKAVPLGLPIDHLLFCGYGGVNTSTVLAPTGVFREYAFEEDYEVQEDISWMLHAGQVLPVIVANEVVCERHLRPGEGLSRPGGALFSRRWYEDHRHLMSAAARTGFLTRTLSKQAACDRKAEMLPWLFKELRAHGKLSAGSVWVLGRPWIIPRRVRFFIRSIVSIVNGLGRRTDTF
ncbi:glycosyltransferase family 2 protein [Arhodomonas sp. SL1]|uniref:glycosyltransferase family 2 protein n=1 Tax=Arhodomonas sp. SL1 TaxID=3425691 RepID=UPI003F881A74